MRSLMAFTRVCCVVPIGHIGGGPPISGLGEMDQIQQTKRIQHTYIID